MTPKNRRSAIAIAIAALVVAAAVAAVAHMWSAIGDVGLSAAGWTALIAGALLALALGIGLMALVFISNRKGFDDAGNWR